MANGEPDGGDRSEGNAELQDIAWLSSLSEQELDFLISFKEQVFRRAKNVGYKDVGDKFNLRMLHALAFICLEFFKDRCRTNPLIPDSEEILRALNGCGLSFGEEKSDCSLSIKGANDLSFATPRRKRMRDGLCGDASERSKRQKKADIDK